MEENKSKKSVGVPLVLVIAILVIALVACIAYIMKNNEQKLALNNNNSEKTINALKTEIDSLKNTIAQKDNEIKSNENKENQYGKIKGTYTYRTNHPDYKDIMCDYQLYLKDDGTFNYVIAIDNHGGFCGNYIINGSELILNKLFYYGSDAGISVVNGQVKLKVNEDGTISDSNKYDVSPINNVLLNRKTTEVEVTETLKGYINYAIKHDAVFGENQ